MTRRDRPETPQQVEVVELMSAETPPLAVLQSRAGHSWWAFLLPRARPNGAEQWRIARSVLDEALSGAEWDELEELSKQPAVASRPGAPRDLCLETATGSDPDGVPWTDLIEVDVSRTGVMRVRRTRRRYPTRPRTWTEVHWDTRAAGLPPTGFRPLELSAFGSQRQVDGLDRFLHGQGIVPENALDEMFSPDRGRVPTGRDLSAPAGVSFWGRDAGETWQVTIGPTGHLRIIRSRTHPGPEKPFLS